ncbi:MAG: hypothetical protein WAO95_17600 [Burkholderiales bacterium]
MNRISYPYTELGEPKTYCEDTLRLPPQILPNLLVSVNAVIAMLSPSRLMDEFATVSSMMGRQQWLSQSSLYIRPSDRDK